MTSSFSIYCLLPPSTSLTEDPHWYWKMVCYNNCTFMSYISCSSNTWQCCWCSLWLGWLRCWQSTCRWCLPSPWQSPAAALGLGQSLLRSRWKTLSFWKSPWKQLWEETWACEQWHHWTRLRSQSLATWSSSWGWNLSRYWILWNEKFIRGHTCNAWAQMSRGQRWSG